MTTILLVEDDVWYAQQQQRLLEASGYTVQHANDAQQAIDLTEMQTPAAVVLDVLLTYNTAFALLHELQSYAETSELPVILYSTQAESLHQESLVAYGVVAVLDKTSMHPLDVVRTLKKVGI